MQCKGFLFDLDGTLVDSLPVVEHSWCKWGDRFAIDHDEILSFIHGKQAITSIRHFMPGRSEEDIQAEFRYLEQIEATDIEGIVALPGALALLNTLNEAGIPWAIVTSGSIPVAHARHRAAGLPMPEVFVTAEQVKHGKPAPDAYLLGAGRLSAGRRAAGSACRGVRGGGRCAGGAPLRTGGRLSHYRGQRARRCPSPG